MFSKASALGVQFDPAVAAKYALPMDPKYALDTKHESWNVLWTVPRRRTIAANSSIADSIYFRVAHDSSYRPENLTFTGGTLASGYQQVPIVTAANVSAGV
jgi:hypothetical protein